VAEPFKNLVSPASVQQLSDALSAVYPDFASERFRASATDGLEALELKARVAHVADALRAELPDAWPKALGLLIAALPEALPDDTGVTGLAWLWPMLRAVEVHGIDHPEPSLDALRLMTQRFSAEFALRPYLIAHPQLAWERLGAWATDPDLHVRRLVSEGSRPRLPWGQQLRASVDDPTLGLALLDRLVDDTSAYVRRSVANHLNDVCRDHPDRALATATAWLAHPSPRRLAVVTRGLRTLIKAGHPQAMALLGLGAAALDLHTLAADPPTVRLGDRTTLRATLSAHADQEWLVDWLIRSPRANGTLSQRVMRGCRRQVRAGERVELAHTLSLKPVTTRVTRPGRWRVLLQVNGTVVGELSIDVFE